MHATVRTEGLNVHSIPNGAIVDAFKRGDRLSIFGDPKHTDTVVWYPVELIDAGLKGRPTRRCGWVDGKFLNFDHDEIKPMPPAPPPPHDFPDDWWEDEPQRPPPLLRTSQLTFWIVFTTIVVGALFLLTWPWWR